MSNRSTPAGNPPRVSETRLSLDGTIELLLHNLVERGLRPARSPLRVPAPPPPEAGRLGRDDAPPARLRVGGVDRDATLRGTPAIRLFPTPSRDAPSSRGPPIEGPYTAVGAALRAATCLLTTRFATENR
jgi:hypothetical protein